MGWALGAVYTLWLRDMIHFFRERSRVVGALLQPLLMWAVIGSGIGSTFAPRGVSGGFSYLQFMYPGIIGMTILFTAIFSTISVIADRDRGFLREILVSPVGVGSIVLAKVLAGTAMALLQGVILLVLAPAIGLVPTVSSALVAVVAMAAMAFGLTALGLAIAWRARSTQGFHMVMNFLLLPMWLLSGSVFPAGGVPAPLHLLMRLNPLTYGVETVRLALAGPTGTVGPAFLTPGQGLAAIGLFAILAFGLALRVCRPRD